MLCCAPKVVHCIKSSLYVCEHPSPLPSSLSSSASAITGWKCLQRCFNCCIWLLIGSFSRFQNNASDDVSSPSAPHGTGADKPQGDRAQAHHCQQQLRALHQVQQPQQWGEVTWEIWYQLTLITFFSDMKASWWTCWRSFQLCLVSLSPSTRTLLGHTGQLTTKGTRPAWSLRWLLNF